MSQAKVDLKKEQKHNRKKLVQKKKREKLIGGIVGAVVAVALIVWIGFSGYGKYQDYVAANPTAVDLSAITDYLSSQEATEDSVQE